MTITHILILELYETHFAYLYSHYEVASEGFDLHTLSTYVAGLGIGLLAGAAVALAPTLADLPTTGAEVVRIAFRLGILVEEVSQNLEPRDTSGSPETWASVVQNVRLEEVQAELDAIHTKEVSILSILYQNYETH
jgi:monodictyphenone polyketide synthase